jgi:hypothetical protein
VTLFEYKFQTAGFRNGREFSPPPPYFTSIFNSPFSALTSTARPSAASPAMSMREIGVSSRRDIARNE